MTGIASDNISHNQKSTAVDLLMNGSASGKISQVNRRSFLKKAATGVAAGMAYHD